jgi:hypothetical protein
MTEKTNSAKHPETLKIIVAFIFGGFYTLALVWGGMKLYNDISMSIRGIEGTIWFWGGFSLLLIVSTVVGIKYWRWS